MSLINKMLQDLEERRSGSEELGIFQGQVRAAPHSNSRGAPWPIILGTVCVIAAGMSAGAWWFYGQQHEKPVMPVPQPVTPDLPLSLKLDPELPRLPGPGMEAMSNPALPGNEAVQAMPAVSADGSQPPISQETAGALSAAAVPPVNPMQRQAGQSAQSTADARTPVTEAWSRLNAGSASKGSQAAFAGSNTNARSALAARDKLPPADSLNTVTDDVLIPVRVSKQVQELTPHQRAENDYRRALELVDQGKSKEAMSVLEQALQIDARHAAARQTLAALLVEAKRPDDAARRLREGLNTDRTQTGLAMMLARLQVDRQELRGAIETLQQSLSYAIDRADYRAFLAALLQRDGRHKETIEHYLAALKKAPGNGIWWMGAAISLQAENRIPEARDAYTRAKMSGSLSPELLAFVDQRLAQSH